MTEREQFEAWALSRGFGKSSMPTSWAWEGWQAARAVQPQDVVDPEVMEMALCESISCVLREGQLYRFVRVGDCKKCEAMSAASFEAYGAPPPSGGVIKEEM